MIFPVSRTIGSIDNYRRHFYTRDVPPSTLTSRTVNLHDPSQDADLRVFVRELSNEYSSVVNDVSSELNGSLKFSQTSNYLFILNDL